MAQNIDNKKTTLEDDAAIYQKTDGRNESISFADNWRKLDRKGKWQYFKEYMLKSIIIALLVIGAIVYLVISIKNSDKKFAYSIYNIEEHSMPESNVVAELEELDKKWKLGKKEIIEYSDELSFRDTDEKAKIMTFITAGSVDALIGTTDELKEYGRFYSDLSECMPEVYDKIPEDAKVELTFMAPKNDGSKETEPKTTVCGIRINKTILAKHMYKDTNYLPDSLILVFVDNGINNNDKNYDDDVAKFLLGIE